MALSTPTNVRVCSRDIQPGDIIRTGFGTRAVIDREVASVERWYYNGYCNANLVFSDGTKETLWAHTYHPAIRA